MAWRTLSGNEGVAEEEEEEEGGDGIDIFGTGLMIEGFKRRGGGGGKVGSRSGMARGG